jgi:cytochrome bd-type quinol oxidase subunit 2
VFLKKIVESANESLARAMKTYVSCFWVYAGLFLMALVILLMAPEIEWPMRGYVALLLTAVLGVYGLLLFFWFIRLIGRVRLLIITGITGALAFNPSD